MVSQHKFQPTLREMGEISNEILARYRIDAPISVLVEAIKLAVVDFQERDAIERRVNELWLEEVELTAGFHEWDDA